MTRRFYMTAFLIFCFAAASFFSVAFWRVDCLVIKDGASGETLFRAPCANGGSFSTRYVHSVELTPVEDEYIVTDGKIWTWQERVKSSNAGMPYAAPRYGKYKNSGDWLIFQGGRISWDKFFLRVGNARFGRNAFYFSPYGAANLFEAAPNARLVVSCEKSPMFLLKNVTEKLYP